MAVGIELPKHYLRKEWLTFLVFMIPVMIFMWLVSGLFIWALIPPLDYLNALVIAACVCPTDPILANSVVKGRFAEKHVPAHIRNALSAESGGNDGMGFPFLFLAIFLIGEPSTGVAVGKWVYLTCLFQIALSVVIGVVCGYVARKILQWSERNHLIDKPSFLCFAIALALFLMSMTGFSGSDDVLACFAAGNAFSWDDWFRQETEEAHFQDVIDMMLNLAVFAYIGAIIPWNQFGNTEIGLTPWRLVIIALLILLFRRLPIVLALKPIMPAIQTYREAIFSGWFGPMGVGAVFLAMIAKEEMEEIYHDHEEKPVIIELISPVVLFIVLSSTLVHGTTIPLFQLGKRIRTRTLSITSTGSNNVVRLPKIQFGQQLNFRRSQQPDDIDLGDGMMSETQRNTLINTIERKEENYRNKAGRAGVALNPELQSIRFVEPVKPRPTQPNLNIEKNEASVSSLRSWLHRHNKDDATCDTPSSTGATVVGSPSPIPMPPSDSPTPLRNVFRRSKPPQQQSSPALAAAESNRDGGQSGSSDLHSIHPRIEVWEEDNHVVIEDTADTKHPTMLSKTDPDWEHKARQEVEKLEAAIIRDEREQKRDEGQNE
ncbi:Sodium/hydrogen exchanger family-domain-containing protein [Dichotomocladium elegans]|nr:Sodium/hydrogen exchanger family-domain-containing protein [Dichotomocladium elegans]